MSDPVFFHVSLSEHRGSILRYGLRARWLFEHAICRYSGRPASLPRQQLWKIPGQPTALYVTCDQAEAMRYAEHLRDRFRVDRDLDLWQITGPLPVERDQDWPGDAWHTSQDVTPDRLTLLAVQPGGGSWRPAGSQDLTVTLPDPVVTLPAAALEPGARAVSSGAQPLELVRVAPAGPDTVNLVFEVEYLYPRRHTAELVCPLAADAPVDVFVTPAAA